MSVTPLDQDTRIEVFHDDKMFFSLDRGKSWEFSDSPFRSYSGFSRVDPSWMHTVVMSQADHNVFYETIDGRPCKLGVSRDGGRSWEILEPTLDTGKEIFKCGNIISTSPRHPGKVYISLHVKERPLSIITSAYISEDYGRRFTRLRGSMGYVVENGEGLIRYGLRYPSSLYKNGGSGWDRIDQMLLTSPIFRNSGTRILTTHRKSESDQEVIPPFPIEQIVVDPEDEQTLYVLTFKGLYRSIDGGLSFELLLLESDKVYGVDAIAVDPHDSDHLYAGVDFSSIFHSSDKGCTWERLSLP